MPKKKIIKKQIKKLGKKVGKIEVGDVIEATLLALDQKTPIQIIGKVKSIKNTFGSPVYIITEGDAEDFPTKKVKRV